MDDEEAILASISFCLRDKYSIVESRDGNDALAKWKSEAPDVIITDLAMPSMDGLELIQTIRRTDKITPIIATTGMMQGHGVLAAAKHFGANAVLCKPFSATELLVLIEGVLTLAP